MYKELDNLLMQEVTIDSWYDDGYLLAQDILNNFTKKDWETLNKKVLDKNIEWQKKLVYALDNNIIEEEIVVICRLLCIKNDELFELCIDSLRAFNNEVGRNYIKNNPQIIQIAKEQMSKVDKIGKKILEDFIKKFDCID